MAKILFLPWRPVGSAAHYCLARAAMLERIGGARRCFRLSQKPAHSNGTSPLTRIEPDLLTSTARTDPQVLGWLKRRLGRDQTARKLYGSIVTQARRPAFYAAWGVPDTPQGRFEMVNALRGVAGERRHSAEHAVRFGGAWRRNDDLFERCQGR